MQFNKSVQSFILTFLSASLLCNAVAQPSFANSRANNTRQGLPGRRISGGVRKGNCFADFNQSLVAIMPRNNLGRTMLARPALWFSVPEIIGEKTAEFQLFNASDEQIYSAPVDISGDEGISKLQLPPSAPELAVDETYRWTFSIGCTDSSQFVVQGWIHRVAPPSVLLQEVEDASIEERITLYSSANLWHEQVTALVNLRQSNTTLTTFQIEWAEMLAAAGLTSYVSNTISEPMEVEDVSSSLIAY